MDQQADHRYLGSDTWLPPECYEKHLVRKAMPNPLKPCDIFVYGLVVWATFIRVHFSPIYNIQRAEGHGAEIVRRVGRQQFYARASNSVRASYSRAHSQVHDLLANLTDQMLSQFGGSKERSINERQRYSVVSSTGRVWRDDTPEIVEQKVRRILAVLRDSLNDSPDLRDPQPWKYLDHNRYPSILPVDGPSKFKPNYDRDSAVKHNNQPQTSPSAYLPSVGRQWLEKGAVITSIQAYLQSNLRWPQRHRERQMIYDEALKQAAAVIPELKNLGPSEFLEHLPDQEHYDLRGLEQAYAYIWRQTTPRFTLPDLYYAWERLTSHIKLCCWHNHQQAFPSSGIGGIDLLQILIDIRAQRKAGIEVLAWCLRGEVGKHRLQQSDVPEEDRQGGPSIWTLLLDPPFFLDDKYAASAVLLLFERGCDIHWVVNFAGKYKLGGPVSPR